MAAIRLGSAQSGVLVAVMLAACMAAGHVSAARPGRYMLSVTADARSIVDDLFGPAQGVSVTKSSSDLLTENLQQMLQSDSKSGASRKRGAQPAGVAGAGGGDGQPQPAADAAVLTVAPGDGTSSGSGGGGGSSTPLRDRVIFNPVIADSDDYVIHLFAGIMDLAEANPALAAAGAAGSIGIYDYYNDNSADYEDQKSGLIIGPSAKGIAAAEGRIGRGVGIIGASAKARTHARSTVDYRTNYRGNAARTNSVGVFNNAVGEASATGVVGGTGNVDEVTLPAFAPGLFGR